MKFRKRKPTATGYYWWRRPKAWHVNDKVDKRIKYGDREPVFIANGRITFIGSSFIGFVSEVPGVFAAIP
jgi:hypothetical protein